jgi:hypothetical protein
MWWRLLVLGVVLGGVLVPKVGAADIGLTPHTNDYLTAPTPHPNPDPQSHSKEWFYNYRLEKFAPSQEPLIAETFGNSVANIKEESVWEYPSVNSLGLGFATNLPTVAMINYGLTGAYGQTTPRSDSYYYNHLFYLTGLQPNTQYHYQIVVQDYDGNSYVSGDRTFTTTDMTGKVALTQAMMPLTLGSGDANKHFVVQEDLSSNSFGIEIGSLANNITIDFNGHTLTYDQQLSTGAIGVLTKNNPQNIKLYNGLIKQGAHGGAGKWGLGFEPVDLSNSSGGGLNEIMGITVEYYGDNLRGLVTNNARVLHNVIYDEGTEVDDRHQAVRALQTGSDAARNVVMYNSLRRFRQRGIDGAGKIFHNELYSDSQVTNSFAIGNASNTEVAYNKIFGMGYLPIGIGWGEHDSNAHDNFIFERCFAPLRRNNEYNRDSSVAGIRFTNYDGASYQNLLYTDNVISLLAENGCTMARGVWFSSDLVSHNLVIADNKIKVIAAEDNITCTYQHISNYYNCDVNNVISTMALGGTIGVQAAYANATVIEDNHLISNIGFVTIGEGYGIGNGLKLKRTTFERVGPDVGEWFQPIRLGFWYWTTWNNRFIDNTLQGLTPAEFEPHFYGGTGSMEAYYGVSKNLTFRSGSDGSPIVNTDSVVTLNGDDPDTDSDQFFLKTDSSGQAAIELLNSYHYKLGNNLDAGGVAGTPGHYYYGGTSTYDFYVYGYKTKRLTRADLEVASEIFFDVESVPSPIPTPPTPIPEPAATPRPTPMPVPTHTVGVLENPIPYSNPHPQTNPDEWFFNYRLEKLAPSVEPLIEETLGSTLEFDEEGFWEYPSFNSVAVSFAFNMSVVALVDYGMSESYGQATAQSDSYFYNHLFHLRDLQPGTTYHYRIQALGADGQTYTSPDYTVTTLAWADYPEYKKFGQAQMPLLITENNTHWVATGDIAVDGWAINVKANDVVIDLNGYTLIYEQNAPDCPNDVYGDCYYDENLPYGIRSGLWNKKNIKIFNGVIKQGKPYGQASSYSPISLFHMDARAQNELAGVWVDYYGDSTPGVSLGRGKAHHNVIYDRGETVNDRHAAVRALALDTPVEGEPSNEVYYNSLRRFRQRGINSGGIIHHNELYMDSQVTNSFGLSNGNNTEIYDNKIFGLGYLAFGVGWGSYYSTVRENVIFLRCFAPNERSKEYGRWSGVAGFRITNFEGEPLHDLLYENNVIALRAEKSGLNGEGGECVGARGIWGSNGVDDVADSVIFRGNTIKVEAMAGNHTLTPDAGGYHYPGQTTFYPWGQAGNAVAPVSMQGNSYLETRIGQAVIFENNHLLSNVNMILVGEGYGIGSGMRFYNTTFEKIDHDSEWFQPVRIGYWYFNTFANKLINNQTIGFSKEELENPRFYGSSGKMEVSFGFGHNYDFVDEVGGAIAGQTVTYASGSAVATVDTSSVGSGYLEFITSHQYRFGNNGNQDKGEQVIMGEITREFYDLGSVYTFSAAGYENASYTLGQLENLETIVLRRVSSGGGGGSSSGGGGGSEGGRSEARAWQCSLTPPHAAPDLFEIRAWKDRAKLYFTPVQGYGNGYLVSFHETAVAEGHGADVVLYPEGVQSYEIYYLKPNTTYYLKVAAKNGCQVGPWSGVLSFKTPSWWSGAMKASYKYEKNNLLNY